MNYLGLPLCIRISKRRLWDPVIERIDKKSTFWKGNYLSLGGRITLIKSMLASMPTYFLSCFKCPSAVVKRLERIRETFFGMIPLRKENTIWCSGIRCALLWPQG